MSSLRIFKDAYENAVNGKDPFTGEPFTDASGLNYNLPQIPDIPDDGSGDNTWNMGQLPDHPSGGYPSDFYSDLADAGDSMEDWISDLLDPSPESFEWPGEEFFDPFNDALLEQYEDLIRSGNPGLVPHKTLDKSAYENDTLEYNRDSNNINDIRYRCSECGELYGFDCMCACPRPKYLDSEVYRYYDDHKGLLSGAWGFNHFDEDGFSAKNGPLNGLMPFSIECGLCGKKMTLDSLDFKMDDDDKFYVGSNGVFKCHECTEKYLCVYPVFHFFWY